MRVTRARHIDELYQLLWFHLFGEPFDVTDGSSGEAATIHFLISCVQAMEAGDQTVDGVSALFCAQAPTTFDFDLWYEEQVEAGIYRPRSAIGQNGGAERGVLVNSSGPMSPREGCPEPLGKIIPFPRRTPTRH